MKTANEKLGAWQNLINNQKIKSTTAVMKMISLIVATVCVCVIIYALFIGDLPESNATVRYIEIGVLLLMLPFIIKAFFDSKQDAYNALKEHLEYFVLTFVMIIPIYLMVVFI